MQPKGYLTSRSAQNLLIGLRLQPFITMTRFFLTTVTLLLTGMLCRCQQIATSAVPAVVKQSFSKLYPGITAKWEKESGKFEAGFKKDKHTMSALFNADGSLTETETDIPVSDLPATAITYTHEHYKGIIIKEAAKITKAGGSINYEAAIKGRDLIFDERGRFLKEVKD